MRLKLIGEDLYMGDTKVATLHMEIPSITWDFIELVEKNFDAVDRAVALSMDIEDLLKSIQDDIGLLNYRLDKAARK